jgi:hypothetical protein
MKLMFSTRYALLALAACAVLAGAGTADAQQCDGWRNCAGGPPRCLIDVPIGETIVSGADSCFWAQTYPCTVWWESEPCQGGVDLLETTEAQKSLLADAVNVISEIEIDGVMYPMYVEVSPASPPVASVSAWVELRMAKCAERSAAIAATNNNNP